MRYIFLLFSIAFQGQVLHHQMLSSQGQSAKLADGLLVNQTIGQQSSIGSSTNKDFVVMQGFQQSMWGKYIASNKIYAPENITITTYPNPFVTVVNFQFSKTITDLISISIFDVTGRLIYEQNKLAVNAILSIDLGLLPLSGYLVRLSSTNLTYYTKILKQND